MMTGPIEVRSVNNGMEYLQKPTSLKIQPQKCFYLYKDTKIPKIMSSSLFSVSSISVFYVSLMGAGFSVYMPMAPLCKLNSPPFHSPIKQNFEKYKESRC